MPTGGFGERRRKLVEERRFAVDQAVIIERQEPVSVLNDIDYPLGGLRFGMFHEWRRDAVAGQNQRNDSRRQQPQ